MMRCGIVAEVSADGDCACMDGGVYDLTYTELGGSWSYTAAPAECGVIAMAVTCVDLENGLHRLTVTLSCDEYNTGTGFVDVTPDELEDLDVEVPVTMTWAGSPPDVDEEPHCCTGSITVRLIRP